MCPDTGTSVRIAVASAGLIGKRHVKVVGRRGTVVISVIVNPDPAAQELADENGCKWYCSITELLAADAPDGAIIATPNQMHVENGLECVRLGVPILVEKPISGDVRSASRLVDEAGWSDVPVLVGHHRRHNPPVHAARRQIENSAIGDIVAVHVSCWFYKPDDYFKVDWRTRPIP